MHTKLDAISKNAKPWFELATDFRDRFNVYLLQI